MSLNTASAFAVSVLRGGRGMKVRQVLQTQPAVPLELYEFESCPFCKKVREVMSELDLEYISRASARGSHHREDFAREGKKTSFPFLVDPNSGTALYESEDIIDYLYATYGSGRNGVAKFFSPLNTCAAFVASAVRMRGSTVSGNARTKQPTELLELYNFEASPYCRKVREALCELDIDCRIRNVAKNSERRAELKEAGGKVMVPYLVDANTGTQMYESDEIVEYLHRTYG